MKENDKVFNALGLRSLVADLRKLATQISKGKGKDHEGCDEYIPEIKSTNDSDMMKNQRYIRIRCLWLIILYCETNKLPI